MKDVGRQDGFALIAVVVIMALMGVALTVFSVQTRDMLSRTRMMDVQCRLDNAIASAAQWAQVNRKTLIKLKEAQSINPDLSEIQAGGLVCSCKTVKNRPRQLTIEITAVSEKPKHTCKKTVQLVL